MGTEEQLRVEQEATPDEVALARRSEAGLDDEITLPMPRAEATELVLQRLGPLAQHNRFELRHHPDGDVEMISRTDVLGLWTPVVRLTIDEDTEGTARLRWREGRQRLTATTAKQIAGGFGLWCLTVLVSLWYLAVAFSAGPGGVVFYLAVMVAFHAAWIRYQKRKNAVARERLRSAIKVVASLSSEQDRLAYRGLRPAT